MNSVSRYGEGHTDERFGLMSPSPDGGNAGPVGGQTIGQEYFSHATS
ncbi:hypothetical protein CGMCC3_g1174 [Colletotrichum fructicola]|nr:uncharacterized protein CGMCC3_g1174 [Colletotrichum fructicola]KAE9583037.1 hypothetical protein CGMCC3_g1174 [Colletotrichum fructicola]